MRKIHLTLLVFLLVAATMFAQRGHGGPGMERLEGLELTTEQQAKIQEIRKSTRAELQALRENGKDREANREAFMGIREKSKAAFMEVLTPEQRAKLEEQRKSRKEAWEQVDKEALKAELKAYREKEMQPVLRAARGQMDQFISAEDQQEIERLRGVFANKPKRLGKKGGPRKGKDQADGERTAAREAMEKWRAEHADDIASLEALATKYQAELERAEKALAPRRATWREEMGEIRAKYLPEGAKPRGRKGGKAKAGKGKKQGKEKTEGRRGGKGKKGAAFLLLKP